MCNVSTACGIDDLTALTSAAELDPRRFATAPSMMAFVGLAPSERSSGPRRVSEGSPQPAMRTCVACWSNGRGTIGTTRRSARRFARAGAPADVTARA